MDHRLLGIMFLLTGIADFIMARRLTGIGNGARTMLYVFGGAFAALGVTMLLGGQKSP